MKETDYQPIFNTFNDVSNIYGNNLFIWANYTDQYHLVEQKLHEAYRRKLGLNEITFRNGSLSPRNNLTFNFFNKNRSVKLQFLGYSNQGSCCREFL